MRRDPSFENLITRNVPSVIGLGMLTPDTSGIISSIQSFTAASNALAGQASFHWGSTGSPFKTLSVSAGGTESCSFNGLEGPIGSGLYVTTTVDMNISAVVIYIDETPGITKKQARANTYFAYVAQKAVAQHAIRTPNMFGEQTEG